jgi:hypothetical protein
VTPKDHLNKNTNELTSNPFSYLNAINNNAFYHFRDVDIKNKDYPAFMINRGLSYFPDTVLYANEMNINHHLDGKPQFSFLINIIRKRKRFSKWNKASESDDIDALKTYYGYSNEKARNVLPLFNPIELKRIKEKINHGGSTRGAL